ncbi:MAG: helix-turn-helix domain-containing protein [Erysipelotrichaceae bacterium]|nr:helix-turn-helix domain-containing protein [Erysipelotrichaceae bacterium]
MTSFSRILKRERIKKGLSKADMARKLNIPYTTYQNYENGREPKIDVIISIAEKLDIDPNVFFVSYDTDVTSNRSYRSRRYNRTNRTNRTNHTGLNDSKHTNQLNTDNVFAQNPELRYIFLYDSKKFSIMKERVDKNYDDLETRYFKLHTLLKDFENELKNFRNDFFIRNEQERINETFNSLYDIIEKSYDDAEYFCQEITYESQYMNKSTINRFKKNNPDYKKQILKGFFHDDPEFELDTENEAFIDRLYQLTLTVYLI